MLAYNTVIRYIIGLPDILMYLTAAITKLVFNHYDRMNCIEKDICNFEIGHATSNFREKSLGLPAKSPGEFFAW